MHDSIKFCDHCDESIPMGMDRRQRKGKTKCGRCADRLTRFWRFWVVLMFIGTLTAAKAVHQGSVKRDNVVKQYVHDGLRFLDGRLTLTIKATIQALGDLQSQMDIRLAEHRRLKVELEKVKLDFQAAKKQIAQRITSSTNKVDEVKLHVKERVSVLESKAKALAAEVDTMKLVSPEKLRHAARATVGINVRDNRRLWRFGSGIIFHRVHEDKKWRYYVHTCYHVIETHINTRETSKHNPVLKVTVFDDVGRLMPTGEFELRTETNFKQAQSHRGVTDYSVLSFVSEKEHAIIPYATDEESRSMQIGDPVLITGVLPTERPAIYYGTVASLTSSASGCMAIQGMAWPGMSGGAILDRRTMKVIGIMQMLPSRPAPGPFRAPGALNNGLGYITQIHRIDKRFRLKIK